MIATCTGCSRPRRAARACSRSGAARAPTCSRSRYASPEVSAVGIDLARTAIEEAKHGGGGGRDRQRRVPARRRDGHHRRPARRVRLRDLPRRLRLDPGRRARRAARRRQGAPRARTASPTSPTTRTPAATCGGCCARRRCGTRATSQPGPEQAEKARELFEFLEIRVAEDPYGGMLGMEVPVLADQPAAPARPRRAVGLLGAGVVPDFAQRRRRPRARLPRRGQPARAVAAELSRRRARSSSPRSPAATAIAREQYQDLLLFRRFRSTMLCHEGADVADALVPDTLRTLLFTARAPDEDLPEGLRRRAQICSPARGRGRDPVRGAARRARRRRRAGGAARGDHGRDARVRHRPARRPAGARARGRRAAAGERARALADRAPARGDDAAARGGADRRPGGPDPAAACSTAPATASEIRRDLAAAGGPELAPSSSTSTCARSASSGCCTIARRTPLRDCE